MTSAISACEAAVFAAVEAGVTGADVYQHVPQDTPPPVVIIGDLEAESYDTKGDEDCEITLTITTVDQAEERKPVLDLMGQVRIALLDKTLTAGGWTFYVMTVQGESAFLLGDGITYEGTTRVRIMATK